MIIPIDGMILFYALFPLFVPYFRLFWLTGNNYSLPFANRLIRLSGSFRQNLFQKKVVYIRP